MKNPLSKYTDEQLRKELERRMKRRRGPVLGYRAICYGDEYDYGGYADYMVAAYGKEQAKVRADKCAFESKNGGYVEEIYKNTPKPGRIH